MTRDEYRKCKWAAGLYHSKDAECEALKMRLAALERENRILKERLGYRKIIDSKRRAEDAECIAIVHLNHVRIAV